MIDKNTYYHFGVAFVGSLILALIFNVMWSSWLLLTAILTWELCQIVTLMKRDIEIKFKPIVWDIVTGIMGTLVGCVIAVWIKS